MSKFSTWLNGLTEDTSPDGAADYLVTYDASATTSKKVKPNNILTASGGIPQDGWVAAGETWTYASADDPTFTFTIAGVDKTTKYYPGMRVKLTQTSAKYFIITKVAFSTDTTVTIYGGTDYDLANAAITLPYYSVVKAPTAFPLDPLKWTVETKDTTLRTQATPTSGTWYNLGSVNIVIPIGVWDVMYSVSVRADDTPAVAIIGLTTLSTANNSESDNDFTTIGRINDVLNMVYNGRGVKTLALTSKTTYYINSSVAFANADNLYNLNANAPCIIRARCSYL